MQYDLQKKKSFHLFTHPGVEDSGRIFAWMVLKKKWPFDPTPGVKGVCKGKTFASMLLYAIFPLIWYATWPYSEKLDFI